VMVLSTQNPLGGGREKQQQNEGDNQEKAIDGQN
jgi:hypothetical protein